MKEIPLKIRDFQIWLEVWFKNSWFIFHDSTWSSQKPYFNKKHIFHKSYRVNRTWDWNQQIRTKLFDNVIISKTYLLIISSTIHFFIIVWQSKITNCKDETTNHWNIYLQFDFLWCQKKLFVKLYTPWKFDFSCSMKMYHFKELP